MPLKLQDEIRQSKPFRSPEEEAYLSIVRTSALLEHSLAQGLKAHDITPTQYNVLSILRGAGTDGLCRNEIGRRLITRMPDVTRLLDRMERAGLVSRVRSTEDRRLVNTILTGRGSQIVDKLDREVAKEHERTLGHMTNAQLTALVDLLSLAREGGG